MKFIPNELTKGLFRQALVMKKQSPHIFFGAGIIGFVGTTVLASKATLKLSNTLDGFKIDVEEVKGLGKDAKEDENGNYVESEYHRDMVYVYSKGTMSVVKLYAPAIGLGIVTIGALTGAHVALTRRNTALTATLVAVTEAYQAYRERVITEIGPEKELDLYYAAKDKEIVNAEGKKEISTVVDTNAWSPYAKIFDEGSEFWEKNSELNRLFVQSQQNYANERLRSRGHIFLNEVYDSLGIDRTVAGSVVGWVIGPEGDNFVDFGIFEASSSRFVNGWERSIILDFNVDGVIYDKI